MRVNNNVLSKKTIGLKRITGLVLVICLICGVLPLSTALRVHADDNVVLVSSFAELRSALSARKTAKLTGDVSGESLSVGSAATLDLNGFLLSCPITVRNHGVLTLIDSDPDTEHSELSFLDQIDGVTIHEVKGGVVTNGIVTVSGGGKFIMDGGTLTGNSGIYVYAAGSAVMNAGLITGNIGSTGSFESDDGTWKGCGPVSVVGNGSVFTMKGGTISYNAGRDFQAMLAEDPDGERTLEDILYNQSGGMGAWGGGTITIEGGSIIGNIHDDGGAVLIGPDGTLNLLGGEICNNVASTGGGIYMYNGTFNMSGGSLSYNKAIGWGTGGALGGWSTLKWSVSLLSSSGVGQGDPLISPGASSEAQVTIPISNTIKITGGTIEGNYAKDFGGGSAPVAV